MSKLEFLLAGYVLTQTVYLAWAIYRDRRLLASKEKDELIMARMRYLEMDFRAAADRNVKIEQMLAGRETFSLEGKKYQIKEVVE